MKRSIKNSYYLPFPIVPVLQCMHDNSKLPIQLQDADIPIKHTATVMLPANQQIPQHHFPISSRLQAYQPSGNGSTHHRTTSVIKAVYYPLKVKIIHQ